MDNRLEELTPLERILVGDLINTIAAEPPDDLVLHRILREAQVKIRQRDRILRATREDGAGE